MSDTGEIKGKHPHPDDQETERIHRAHGVPRRATEARQNDTTLHSIAGAARGPDTFERGVFGDNNSRRRIIDLLSQPPVEPTGQNEAGGSSTSKQRS